MINFNSFSDELQKIAQWWANPTFAGAARGAIGGGAVGAGAGALRAREGERGRGALLGGIGGAAMGGLLGGMAGRSLHESALERYALGKPRLATMLPEAQYGIGAASGGLMGGLNPAISEGKAAPIEYMLRGHGEGMGRAMLVGDEDIKSLKKRHAKRKAQAQTRRATSAADFSDVEV